MPTEEQIKVLAYSMWEQEGRPNGKDWEHYYAARRALEEREETEEHMAQDLGAENIARAARSRQASGRQDRKRSRVASS